MTNSLGIVPVPDEREHPFSDAPAPRDYWYFTFGLDHPLAKRYVILLGTHEETRRLMTAIFGQGNWGEQYTRERGGMIATRHGLVKLELGL
jgi:hypothetical protein